jgi:hypothetical protein
MISEFLEKCAVQGPVNSLLSQLAVRSHIPQEHASLTTPQGKNKLKCNFAGTKMFTVLSLL